MAVLEAAALVEAAEKVGTAPRQDAAMVESTTLVEAAARQDATMVETAALVEATGQAVAVEAAAVKAAAFS